MEKIHNHEGKSCAYISTASYKHTDIAEKALQTRKKCIFYQEKLNIKMT